MGHALGFYHHQSRYDRENYVTVMTGNILSDSSSQAQYAKETQQDTTNFNLPYDYGSVMHYADSRKN